MLLSREIKLNSTTLHYGFSCKGKYNNWDERDI